MKLIISLFAGIMTLLVTSVAFAGGDDGNFLAPLMDAALSKNWIVLTGLSLTVAIAFARKLLAKKFEWFATSAGGFALATSMSGLVAFVMTLVAGKSVGLETLMAGLMAGLVAMGGWSGLWKHIGMPLINKFGPGSKSDDE